MNISSLHSAEKAVSAQPLFKGTDATATALRLLAGGHLKEHITKVEALLVCVSGAVVFENEKGERHALAAGDLVRIEPMVKHWLDASEDSQLLLLK